MDTVAKVDSNVLVEALQKGIQSNEQITLLNRVFKSVIGVDLFNLQNQLSIQTKSMIGIIEKVNSRYAEELEMTLPSMPLEDIKKELEFLNRQALNLAEHQRKIVQGKPLFEVESTLTEEEKGILELCKEMKTPEMKAKFIATLKEVIAESQQPAKNADDDFDELPK